MAERVEIRGGDLDGSILNNAATEATLLRLVSLMEKTSGIKSSYGSNKIQDLYNRSLNTSNKNLNETTKQTSALGNAFNKASGTVTETTGVIGNLLGKTFGMAVTTATLAVSGLRDFLISSYTEFKSLSESGAAFNNNMVEASKYALSTGMGLRDFTELIQKNNTVLTSLGGTATEGAKRLGKLSDEIRTGDVGKSLFGLGMTTNDINEYLGSYLEQQQKLGSLQRKDNRELREGTRLYAEELDKVSKLYGIERKRLDEQSKKQSLDPVFNLLKRGLSPEELAKSTANLSAAAEIGGQQLQDAIKELAVGVVRSPLARELQSTGALTKQTARDISQGRVDIGKALKNTGRVLDASNRYNSDVLVLNVESFNQAAALRDKLIALDDADLDRRNQEAEKRNKLTTAFGRFPAILNNLYNKILGSIVNNKVFDKLISILESAAEGLEKYFEPVVTFFSDLATRFTEVASSDGIGAAFKDMLDRMLSGFTTSVLPKLKEVGTFLFEYLKEPFEGIGKFFTETLIPKTKEFFKNLFNFEGLKNFFTETLVSKTKELFGNLFTFEDLKNFFTGTLIPKTKELFGNLFTFEDLKKFFTGTLIPKTKELFGDIFDFETLKKFFTGTLIPKTKELFSNMFNFEDLKKLFEETLIPGAKKMLKELFGFEWPDFGIEKLAGDFIRNMLSSLVDSFKNWIRDAIGTIITGAGIGALIGGLIGMIFGPAGAVTGAITGANIGAKAATLIKGLTDLFGEDFFGPFGQGIINLGKSVGNLWPALTDTVMSVKDFILGKFDSFVNGIKKFFNFFSDLPLLIEKTVSETVGGGKIANILGLRSVSDIEGELSARRAARSNTQSGMQLSERNLTENQPLRSNTQSGMQIPESTRPGATGTQKLTQEEAKKNVATTGSQTSTTPTATTTQQKLEAETTIENLKNIEKAMQALISNSPTQEQTKQLNTLLEQLLAVSKQQLEANQDLVKAAKGSYNPL